MSTSPEPTRSGGKQPSEPPVSLDALFGAMDDVVVVIDTDGNYVWIAPTLAAREPENQKRAEYLHGRSFFTAFPDNLPQANAMLAAVRAAVSTGETQRIEYKVHLWGVDKWFSASVSRISDDKAVWVARDVTEGVLDQRQLEDRVGERTRELTLLLEVSRVLASNVTLRSLVGDVLEQVKSVIDYSGSSVVTIRPDGLEVIDSLGPNGREHEFVGMKMSVDLTSILFATIVGGEPVVIDDVLGDSQLAADLRTVLGENSGLPAFQYIRSWMAVPLPLEGRVVGFLTMSKDEPAYFKERHLELATAVARQAAVVAENARLFEETQRSAREQEAMLEVSRALASTLELQPLLDLILDNLREIVPYDGSGIALVDKGTMRQIAVRRPPGYPVTAEELASQNPVEDFALLWEKVQRGESVIIDDVWDDTPEAESYRNGWGGELRGSPVEYQHSWVAVPLISRDRVIGVLSLGSMTPGHFHPEHARLVRAFADQAAVAIENARLFEEAERHAREQDALLEVSRALASTLDLQPLMESILDELRNFIDYAGASVNLLHDGMFRQLAVRRPRGPEVTEADLTDGWSAAAYEIGGAMLEAGEPLIIDDVYGDSPGAEFYRNLYGGSIDDKPISYVRAFMSLPLIARGKVLGALSLAHDEPGFFTRKHAEQLHQLASQAAVAIENARLFTETTERTQQLAALLEVSRSLASTLELEEVIAVVLDQLHTIIDHTGSALITLEDDVLLIRDSRAILGADREVGARIPLSATGEIWRLITDGKPVIIADIRADEPLADDYRRTISSVGLLEQPPFTTLRSWMGVPLRAKGGVIGMLTMSKDEPGYFQINHAQLASAFADHAAVALVNARLFDSAQRLAAVEERQRLARELHDSVSQALYGIALGARTARTQLDRDPVKAAEPVDYVLSLAEAGLAEMRSLIFELRPESLESEGLVSAIQKQVGATQARYGIEVRFDASEEPAAALPVKEALYRIAQEAVHNTVKHAQATHITITLQQTDGSLALELADDGQGFDAGADFPGHLGLRSMRERAEALRGSISIKSGVDGTVVRAELPVN